jgi:predicted acyl esterase
MPRLHRFPCALLVVLTFTLTFARAQQPAPAAPTEDYVRAHYTKYEFRIPMRDGKRLFTAVYVPKDAAGGPYPFLMDRTPYSVGSYGEDQYPAHSAPQRSLRRAATSLSTRMCAAAG